MVNITKVYKRKGAHIHAHTDVYINNEYVGYYIRSKKTCRDESLQWYFVAELGYQLENFPAGSIQDITKLLKSHFEWRVTTCYMKVGI